MSNKIVNLFRIDRENVGDLASSPLRYFSFGREVIARDLGEEPQTSNILIVGGGGQYQFPNVGAHIARARLAIGWGIGSNDHYVPQLTRPPEWTAGFRLLGGRDYDACRWVPCASCMSPAMEFARNIKPVHPVVMYDHWMFGLKKDHPAIKGLPYATNRDMELTGSLNFLASGSTVLTTSYHGAYWATLLGRRVVVLNPWSSKFYGFKHSPELAIADDWKDAAQRARSYPEALQECRNANLEFFKQVQNLIT